MTENFIKFFESKENFIKEQKWNRTTIFMLTLLVQNFIILFGTVNCKACSLFQWMETYVNHMNSGVMKLPTMSYPVNKVQIRIFRSLFLQEPRNIVLMSVHMQMLLYSSLTPIKTRTNDWHICVHLPFCFLALFIFTLNSSSFSWLIYMWRFKHPLLRLFGNNQKLLGGSLPPKLLLLHL